MTEKPRTTRVSLTVTIAICVTLPVLYVLSVGPIVRLAMTGSLGPAEGPVVQAAHLYYLPLGWCRSQGIPLFGDVLDWYLKLWLS